MKLTEKISIVTGVISLIGLIASGILGDLYASIIALSLSVASGFYFLISKYIQLSDNLRLNGRMALLKNYQYVHKYEHLDEKPIRINKKERRVTIQPDFLSWNKFAIVFWVKIEEDIFHSSNNKYLISYYSEKVPDYNYRDAFYLGIKRIDLEKDEFEWRFIIGGNDYEKQKGIYFPSSQNLVGWKHFVISWNSESRDLRLLIDGGNVLDKKIQLADDYFPKPASNEVMYFGGWKNWKGGLSSLEYFHIRIFKDSINQGTAKELFEIERPYMKKYS